MNLASRIESNAPAGAVWVSAACRSLCEPAFEWGGSRRITVKGRREVVEVFTAEAVRPGVHRRRGIEGRRAALTGRAAELAAARAALADLELRGRGGALFVVGDAGHGKTRLLAELAAAASSAEWLEGGAASHSSNQPYAPLRLALADWLGLAAHPPLRARVQAERNLRGLLGEGYEVHGAALHAVLGLGEEAPPGEDAVPRALEALFEAAAARAPLVLVVDDLHWADASTVALLGRLLALTDQAPFLLVVAMRPETGQASWALREQARRQHAHRLTEVELRRLAREEMGALLAELAGGPLEAGVAGALVDAAGGVPFFLEELVRSLLEDGALALDPATPSRLVPTGAAGRALRLPTSVEQVVLSRVSRLDAAAGGLLGAASVLGRVFDRALLDAVAPVAPVAPAVPGAPAAEGDALVALQRAELLVELERWPRPTYRFVHALAQDAVRSTLTDAARRALHRRAAEHLAARAAANGPGEPAELARHWLGAGDADAARAALLAAAAAAETLQATAEAFEHYRAALELGEDAPTLFAVGRLALWMGRLDRCGDAFARLFTLPEADVDPDIRQRAEALASAHLMHDDLAAAGERLRRAAQGASLRADLAAEARSCARLAIVLVNGLDLAGAAERAERALLLADKLADLPLRLEALDAQKLVALFTGDLTAQRRALDELEAHQRASLDRVYLPYTLQERGVGLAAASSFVDALAALDEAIALSEEADQLLARNLTLVYRCRVLRSVGRYDAAVEAAEAAQAMADTAFLRSWAEAEDAAARAERYEPDCAVALAGAARAAAEGGGYRYVALAGAALLARLAPADDEAVAAALALVGSVRLPPGRAFVFGWDSLTALAWALIERRDLDRAQSVISPLVVAAEASGWPEAAAAGLLTLAACVEPGRAAPLVARALARAQEAGAPGVQWRAHAAAAGLERGGRAKAAQLVAAQRIIDRLAGALADSARFAAGAEAELNSLLDRFER